MRYRVFFSFLLLSFLSSHRPSDVASYHFSQPRVDQEGLVLRLFRAVDAVEHVVFQFLSGWER